MIPPTTSRRKCGIGCLPFLFEIKIPNVAINQSDDQRSAQQNRCCADMIAP